MNEFVEIPANKRSLVYRKPIFNIGINDANYQVQPIINGKQLRCPYYVVWIRILTRCYDRKYHTKQPTYKDCYICDEWKLFSNFRK